MKWMIIDGNSLINRAFYGVRPLTTRDGLNTNAVYGFLNILLRLIEDEAPDGTAVAFDRREPTFRHITYEGYKAQRKGMPEELAEQMPVLKDLLDAMGITRYELPGYEADDILGTFARLASERGDDCVVVTGDRDSLQLVGERITVNLVTTAKGQTRTVAYTPEVFFTEYGFTPEKMVDYKALMGDPSDNIPGVPGVGAKTALDLVARFGGMGEIYETLDALDIKPGVRTKLADGHELAKLSFDLALICREVPVPIDFEEVRRAERNDEALHGLLVRLEFKKFIERLAVPEAAKPSAPESALEMVEVGPEGAEAALAGLGEGTVAVAAAPDFTAVAFFAGGKALLLRADRYDADGYSAALRSVFGGERPKILHDAKPLMSALLGRGIEVCGVVFDTALAAYVLSPADGNYTPGRVAGAYLNRDLPPDSMFSDAAAFSALDADGESATALCRYAEAVYDLYPVLSQKLEEVDMHTLYYTVELPLCRLLAEMECAGIRVDRGALAAFSEVLTAGITTAEQAIYAHAGMEFNINSTKQLGEILFDKLGLPHIKKTKTGYSTNIDVLEKLRGMH
ncbi:DNA polymerase I, partial [Oscillospiraceae bacterium OttesenSCG-928-F05]|nr:DNA polymerase I [Oscillospiraceae bacterium OttesenSCG-928-F05]